jgi:putative SOS response-associated peptidase YedK
VCNLYRLSANKAEFLDYFKAGDAWQRGVEKDYVAPGKPGYVVRQHEGVGALDVMSWGFPFQGRPVTNVRNYTSPFWKSALANPERRCLVPFTSFQEWSVELDPISGKKRPYWFDLKASPIGAFAGIWRPAEGGAVFSFLTCGYDGDPAAHIVGAIHPKACPVILHVEDYDRWLRAPLDDVLTMATPYPSQLMSVSA